MPMPVFDLVLVLEYFDFILGSRYDHIFAFGEILKNERIAPKLIRNGNRLYQMSIKGKGLTTTVFRDS